MKNSGLVISLDFELLWGVFDKVDFKEKKVYFENTLEVIPKILSLFEEYEIHATWATVGMLFNPSWQDWKNNQPDQLPSYESEKLSAYKFSEENNYSIPKSLCFAPELIHRIAKAPKQEFASHTYCHYYCLENGQSISQFKADMQKNIELAHKNGLNIKSLVFPRNQFNEDYLKVCEELGITSVRINPTNWYWNSVAENSLKNKIFRTGDAYFGLNDKSYKISEVEFYKKSVSLQKASRFLRPRSSRFNDLRLKRIKQEITHAAKNNLLYHLWWHPHNFGNQPDQSLKDLKVILEHFKICRKKYHMESLTMNEVYSKAQQLHKSVENL